MIFNSKGKFVRLPSEVSAQYSKLSQEQRDPVSTGYPMDVLWR